MLVISRFGFEGWILVLIAPVPCHCLLVTFSSEGWILTGREIIIKSLDPLRAKKTFIRKKPEENTVNLLVLIMAVVSKTYRSKNTKIFQI